MLTVAANCPVQYHQVDCHGFSRLATLSIFTLNNPVQALNSERMEAVEPQRVLIETPWKLYF